MVDNPEELTEVEMYRDPATGKLIGRDPETGDTFPIPFDQISANSVQSDTAQVDGTATVEALEAEKADTRSGWNDVSDDRDVDVWYENDTGSDLDVVVTTNPDSSGVDMGPRLEVGSTQSIDIAHTNRFTTDTGNDRITVSLTVEAGGYYRLRTFGDDDDYAIGEWEEQS